MFKNDIKHDFKPDTYNQNATPNIDAKNNLRHSINRYKLNKNKRVRSIEDINYNVELGSEKTKILDLLESKIFNNNK